MKRRIKKCNQWLRLNLKGVLKMKITETKYAVIKESRSLMFLTVNEEYTPEISGRCLFSKQDAQDIADQMSDDSNKLRVIRVKVVYDVQTDE